MGDGSGHQVRNHHVRDANAAPGQGDAPPIIADETEFDEAGQPLPRQIIQPEAGLRGKLCPNYARPAAQLGRKRLIGSFHGLQLLGLKYWRFPCQHAAEVGVQAPSIEFTPPPDIAGGPDAEEFGASMGYARPGGNVTGSAVIAPELVGKCLELLKQAVPGASRRCPLASRRPW